MTTKLYRLSDKELKQMLETYRTLETKLGSIERKHRLKMKPVRTKLQDLISEVNIERYERGKLQSQSLPTQT